MSDRDWVDRKDDVKELAAVDLLLIEDNGDVGLCLRRRIEGAGHLLERVEGRRAFDRVASARYDAVILDLDLPSLDGIGLCARLRQASPRLPILVLSTRDRIADRLACFSAGADDVLAMPVDFDELMARLAAIQRREAPQRDPAPAGPHQIIVLDRKRRDARRTSHVVGLTGREFQFFDVLLKQKTKGVSLATAFRTAFGLDLDVLHARIDGSQTKLGVFWSLALLRDIGRKYVLAGARLERRRAPLVRQDRMAPPPL